MKNQQSKSDNYVTENSSCSDCYPNNKDPLGSLDIKQFSNFNENFMTKNIVDTFAQTEVRIPIPNLLPNRDGINWREINGLVPNNSDDRNNHLQKVEPKVFSKLEDVGNELLVGNNFQKRDNKFKRYIDQELKQFLLNRDQTNQNLNTKIKETSFSFIDDLQISIRKNDIYEIIKPLYLTDLLYKETQKFNLSQNNDKNFVIVGKKRKPIQKNQGKL